MRIVVFGVGAVGGVIGGRLHQHADRHGHDVVCIARGAQYDAMEARGLRVLSPDGEVTVRVPVVRDPREITWTGGEVVILAMKTQDTAAALASLQAAWDLRDGGIMLMYADPLLARLRDTAGYVALAKAVGFI